MERCWSVRRCVVVIGSVIIDRNRGWVGVRVIFRRGRRRRRVWRSTAEGDTHPRRYVSLFLSRKGVMLTEEWVCRTDERSVTPSPHFPTTTTGTATPE